MGCYKGSTLRRLLLCFLPSMIAAVATAASQNYTDALTKSILFYEGQRSGKLPPTQRMKWRKDSALHDGADAHMNLVGGYYDAGDNVKFSFPMAFSVTMLSWSVIEFGNLMGQDLKFALEAIRWGTDYFLKATKTPGVVVVQVGDPNADHSCWERPEDMDTPRTTYTVNEGKPGSEVSAEIAAALAASSLALKGTDAKYSAVLLQRAIQAFDFANKFRESYNGACPFYCDISGYTDELIWGAAWLYKATEKLSYWDFVKQNAGSLGRVTEFGWDSKDDGVNVLVSQWAMRDPSSANPFIPNADKLICSLLPDSPSKSVTYTNGGLLFKGEGSNLQHATALSFLLVVYSRYMQASKKVVNCGNVAADPAKLIALAKSQVDYILGSNPQGMSYMVGYGLKFPQRIHHRGATLPSVDQHPQHIACSEGFQYMHSNNPNANILTGAVVGGPDQSDSFKDSRDDYAQSEITTYINAPLVGVLAYFKANPN